MIRKLSCDDGDYPSKRIKVMSVLDKVQTWKVLFILRGKTGSTKEN